jgi:hypothetical protein
MTILDQINEKLKNAPPAIAQEVLDLIEFLESKHRLKVSDERIEDFVGVPKDPPGVRRRPGRDSAPHARRMGAMSALRHLIATYVAATAARLRRSPPSELNRQSRLRRV